MAHASKPRMITLILWATAWALVLITSALLFKGNPLGDWIEAALFIAAITFWFWQYQRLARHR